MIQALPKDCGFYVGAMLAWRTERSETTEPQICPSFLKTCRALISLIALRSISAQARFAPQEVLFAALTLRAALQNVRYSATLRFYSGFVEMPRSEELSTLSNRA